MIDLKNLEKKWYENAKKCKQIARNLPINNYEIIGEIIFNV